MCLTDRNFGYIFLSVKNINDRIHKKESIKKKKYTEKKIWYEFLNNRKLNIPKNTTK